MSESISRLMDGEVDYTELERCCTELTSNDAVVTWVCYHVIGDHLRGSGGHSRSSIQRLIKDGHVQVDGRSARANQPMKPGQTVLVDVPGDPARPFDRARVHAKFRRFVAPVAGAAAADYLLQVCSEAVRTARFSPLVDKIEAMCAGLLNKT